jgi:hypothetical protein
MSSRLKWIAVDVVDLNLPRLAAFGLNRRRRMDQGYGIAWNARQQRIKSLTKGTTLVISSRGSRTSFPRPGRFAGHVDLYVLRDTKAI